MSEIYGAIEVLREEFGVAKLCQILKVSRSAYYVYLNEKSYILQGGKLMVSQGVKRIFEAHKRRYGWRRVQVEPAAEGLQVGRHQIRRRMIEQDLMAIQPKSFVPKTAQSHPHLRRSPNLLLSEENLPKGPNQVTVGDITYLPNGETGYDKWLDLAIWLDLYSHRIVGWHIDRQMEESLAIQAVQQVIKGRQPEKKFLVHTDGGGQYGSGNFRGLLALHGFR